MFKASTVKFLNVPSTRRKRFPNEPSRCLKVTVAGYYDAIQNCSGYESFATENSYIRVRMYESVMKRLRVTETLMGGCFRASE